MGLAVAKPCASCVSCEAPSSIPNALYCRCGEEDVEDIEDIKSDSKAHGQDSSVFGSPPGFPTSSASKRAREEGPGIQAVSSRSPSIQLQHSVRSGAHLVSRPVDALAEIPDAGDTSHWPHESSETKLRQLSIDTSNASEAVAAVAPECQATGESPRSGSDARPASPCNSIPDDPSYFQTRNLRGLALISAVTDDTSKNGPSSQLMPLPTNPKVLRDGAETDVGFAGPYDRLEAAAAAAKIPLPTGLMSAGSTLHLDNSANVTWQGPISPPANEVCIIDPANDISADAGLLAPVRLDRPELPAWPKGVFIGCRMLVDRASANGGEAQLVVVPVEISGAPSLRIPVTDLCVNRHPGGGLDGLGALVHVELCTGATPEPDVLFCADFEQQEISEEFERCVLAAARARANAEAGVSTFGPAKSPPKQKLTLVAEEPQEMPAQTDGQGSPNMSRSSCRCFPGRRASSGSRL